MKKFKDYKKEDAPANNTSGVANWNPPLGKSSQVMTRKKKKLDIVNLTNLNDYRIDGRKKNYRAAVKRIRERQEKLRERELKKKLSMFGVQGNPFIPTFTKEETELKEDTSMSKKYLETKPGSLEAAVHSAVESETPQTNPDTGRTILTLPKNKYLNTKEGSLENAVEQLLVEKHDPSHYDPATHTQVGSKQKIKPSFNTKTHRLIVKDGTVKIIAKAIWRARGKAMREQGWSLAEALDDVNPKALKGKHKDREDKDIDNDGDVDSTDKYLHKRRKAIGKATKNEDHNCEEVHPEISHKEWLAQEKDAKDQDKDPVGQVDEILGVVGGALAGGAAAAVGDLGARHLIKKYKERKAAKAKNEEEEIDEIAPLAVAGAIRAAPYVVRGAKAAAPYVAKAAKWAAKKIIKNPVKATAATLAASPAARELARRKSAEAAAAFGKKAAEAAKRAAAEAAKKAAKSKITKGAAAAAGIGTAAYAAKKIADARKKKKEAEEKKKNRTEGAELDELSPATKKSYTKKAASDISQRLHNPQDMGPVNRKKMDDRIKGIKRAAEEVEMSPLVQAAAEKIHSMSNGGPTK